MTENEAIEVLKDFDKQAAAKADGAYQSTIGEMACKVAISALEEIQQYRELGTVEDIKQIIRDLNVQIEHSEHLAEVLKSAKCILSKREKLLKEYSELGTPDELWRAMEKQRAKKPKTILRRRGGFEMEHCPNCDTDYQVDRRYEINDDYCPTCGKLLDSSFRSFCGNCGQAMEIKRSEEE